MPDRGDIAGIVLAAGSSRRFGADKLLHPLTLRGTTLPLAAHSLLPWLNNFGRVTVVVRPESEAFRSAVETSLGIFSAAAIRWIVCQEAGKGMAASLACGVRANEQAAGWMIGLADMPAVPSSAIAAVRHALLSGAELSAASCNGRRGHPTGFANRYYEELSTLQGDTGARGLLERDASRLVQVGVEDNGIFADIDAPVDVQNFWRVNYDSGGV